MILDERNEFCDATSAVRAIGNAIIGDVIDLEGTNNTLKDMGSGEPLYLVVQANSGFTSTSSTATVQIQFVSDSVAALTDSRTVHWDSGALVVTALPLGTQLVVALPQEDTYERYIGLWLTIAVDNTDTGSLNAFLTHDVAKYSTYAMSPGATID